MFMNVYSDDKVRGTSTTMFSLRTEGTIRKVISFPWMRRRAFLIEQKICSECKNSSSLFIIAKTFNSTKLCGAADGFTESSRFCTIKSALACLNLGLNSMLRLVTWREGIEHTHLFLLSSCNLSLLTVSGQLRHTHLDGFKSIIISGMKFSSQPCAFCHIVIPLGDNTV